MKKRYWALIGCGGLIAIIVAFSLFVGFISFLFGDSEPTETEDETEIVEEITDEEEKEEKEEKKESDKKEEEEKEKDKATKENKASKEEREYEDNVIEITSKLSNDMYDFGVLSEDLGGDMSLMYDDNFVIKYVAKIATIDHGLDKIEELKPPKKYEDVHEELLKAVESYRSIQRDLPSALDNMDIDTIDKVGNDMIKGNEHIEKATKLMEEK